MTNRLKPFSFRQSVTGVSAVCWGTEKKTLLCSDHGYNYVVGSLTERGTMTTNMLDNWYTRLTKWYLSKPWYMRLLCIGLVVVIVVLFLLRFLFKGVPKEYSQTVDVSPPLPDPTGGNDVEENTNAENTLAIKNVMIGQLKERNEALEVFSKQAVEIINAKTMGELHDLRKKFNL